MHSVKYLTFSLPRWHSSPIFSPKLVQEFGISLFPHICPPPFSLSFHPCLFSLTDCLTLPTEVTTMSNEASIKTNWAVLKQQDADEVKVPVVLFILCKTVTEDSTAGLLLNGTIVQRVLWEGEPPPTAQNDTPYFQVSLKGSLLAGGRLEERRSEARVIDGTTACLSPPTDNPTPQTTLVHATINLAEAPVDIRPHWSL